MSTRAGGEGGGVWYTQRPRRLCGCGATHRHGHTHTHPHHAADNWVNAHPVHQALRHRHTAWLGHAMWQPRPPTQRPTYDIAGRQQRWGRRAHSGALRRPWVAFRLPALPPSHLPRKRGVGSAVAAHPARKRTPRSHAAPSKRMCAVQAAWAGAHRTPPPGGARLHACTHPCRRPPLATCG
jgi:hypothetical protein